MTMKDDDSTSPVPTRSSRRAFLKFAALLAGSVGMQSLPQFKDTASAAMDTRAYAAGRFALELDGILLDFLKSIDGGFAQVNTMSWTVFIR